MEVKITKIECFKVKKGKQTKIGRIQCNANNREKLLNQGYAVTKVTTLKDKTKIETFSPKTFQESFKAHKKLRGNIIPF